MIECILVITFHIGRKDGVNSNVDVEHLVRLTPRHRGAM